MQRSSPWWGLILTVGLVIMLFSPPPGLSEELDCLIEPFRVVTIISPEVGILESVNVDRGDLVTQGQVLAQLDSQLEGATNAVSHARAKLTNQHLANLELRRASAELERRRIKSPITGVVIERSLHPGEFAKQDPILKLAQLDPLRVEVFAPVSLLGDITVGMEAEVFPEKPITGSYKAIVSVADRVVDAASGTFGVRLELPNPDYTLPAGLKCRVKFPTKG